MTRELIAQTVDGTKSVDMLAPPFSVRGEDLVIDFGQPTRTDAGKLKKRYGERTTDADWNNREIIMEMHIAGSDLDDMRGHYRDWVEIVTSDRWVLIHNSGGATEANRYYDCFETVDVPGVYNFVTWSKSTFQLDLTIEAKPFARGPAVDLPKNYIMDPLFCEDFNDDGIANSLVNDDSGTPPTHYNFVGAKSGTASQTIGVAAGAGGAGRYAGLKQVVFSDAPTYPTVVSARIEFYCQAVTGTATYDILVYCAGAATPEKYLLQARTAVQSTYTEVKFEGWTIPAGTTSVELRIRINAPATNDTGSITFRKAMLVVHPTTPNELPKGKDGGTLFYCTTGAESPVTMNIENIPGDVDALALLQLGTTTPAGVPGWQNINVTSAGVNTNYAGVVTPSIYIPTGYPLDQWVAKIKFKTSASLTNCKVRIFISGPGITTTYLRDSAVAVTSETELTAMFNTYSVTTFTITAQIYGTGTGMVGTLWIKNVSVYFLYRGWLAYSNTMQQDSDANGICDGFVNDDSGAMVHANTMENVAASNDLFQLGNDPRIDEVGDYFDAGGLLLYKFSGASDAKCLGGVCSAAKNNGTDYELTPNVLAAGRYLVCARMKTTSATASADTFYLKQYQYNQTGVSTFATTPTTVKPFTVANKWTVVAFGVLDIPSWKSPSWANFRNSLVLASTGSGGSTHVVDYLELLPVSNSLRARPSEIDAYTIVSDSIDDNHALYVVNSPAGPQFPFLASEFSSNNCVPLAQKHLTDYITLASGKVNTLLANITRTATAADADQVQSIANAVLGIRYVPRYLE